MEIPPAQTGGIFFVWRGASPKAGVILFLADRSILIDDPKDKDFSPFGDARHKIESDEIIKSREMYFAIYQALAEDDRILDPTNDKIQDE